MIDLIMSDWFVALNDGVGSSQTAEFLSIDDNLDHYFFT